MLHEVHVYKVVKRSVSNGENKRDLSHLTTYTWCAHCADPYPQGQQRRKIANFGK
jgi:hypothetical protein